MSSFRPEGSPRPHSPEQAPKPPRIRLEIFRHDEKAKEATAGPREADTGIRLTAAGRAHATETGKDKHPHPQTSIALGSPRDRASETSLRHMLANEAVVTPDSSLEEMRTFTETQIPKGRKERTTELLDFEMGGTEEFNKIAYEHYLDKKDFLDWTWKESDALVQQLHDKDSSTYSRMAGNVAELVQKYVSGFSRWSEIVSKDPQRYAEFDNELQRHLGSHQSVTESFLMKVIEKTAGDDEVEGFINSLKSRNGFDFSEGFSVEVIGEAQNPSISVRFREKEWSITPATLEEIIGERDELNESIE